MMTWHANSEEKKIYIYIYIKIKLFFFFFQETIATLLKHIGIYKGNNRNMAELNLTVDTRESHMAHFDSFHFSFRQKSPNPLNLNP
jgi:hypothetical protein